MFGSLRVGLAPPPRAASAGEEGHVPRLEVGGLSPELPHRGVLVETGSLLVQESRGSSCADIDCICVSLWPCLS